MDPRLHARLVARLHDLLNVHGPDHDEVRAFVLRHPELVEVLDAWMARRLE